MLTTIKNVKKNSSHILWVLMQQIVAKSILSLKFLLMARLLGPEKIGLFGVATVVLSIIEGVTELGLNQAIVQTKKDIDFKSYNIVWTLQLVRGLIISSVLFLGSFLVIKGFSLNYPIFLFMLLSMIPLVRGFTNIGVAEATRNLNFKPIAFLQIYVLIFDIILTIIFLFKNNDVESVILAMVLAESLKVLLSYIMFRNLSGFNVKFKEIKDLISYGKWILFNSMLNVVSNQIDKLYTTIFLGVTQLGIYQVSFKVAQFGLADLATAFSQYLFPKLSNRFREGTDKAYRFFNESLRIITIFAIATFTFLWLNMNFIILTVLGNEWAKAIFTTKLLLINMSVGALMSVIVPFVRAIGIPQVATKATLIQIIIFAILGFFSLKFFGLKEMILVIIISIVISYLLMLLQVEKNFKGFINKYILFVTKIIIIPIVLIMMPIPQESLVLLTISGIAYVLVILYLLKRTKKSDILN